MTKIGSFKIETSFNITGRGIVVSGQVIEGVPLVGTFLSANISGEEEIIKIIGTEIGNPDANGIMKFGLLLSIEDPLRVKHIGENKIKEQVVSIFKD